MIRMREFRRNARARQKSWWEDNANYEETCDLSIGLRVTQAHPLNQCLSLYYCIRTQLLLRLWPSCATTTSLIKMLSKKYEFFHEATLVNQTLLGHFVIKHFFTSKVKIVFSLKRGNLLTLVKGWNLINAKFHLDVVINSKVILVTQATRM